MPQTWLLRQVSMFASFIFPHAMLLHQLFCWTALLFLLQFLVTSKRLPKDLRCCAPGCSSHTHPAALMQTASWGERMFTMLWSCLLPSLSATASDQRHKKNGEVWGRECCISFHPSLPPLPPHFWASFPLLPSCFYISCLRLPSKGQRAFVFSVCAGYIWLAHQTQDFPLHGPSQRSTFRA